jgi:hypothetical protein
MQTSRLISKISSFFCRELSELVPAINKLRTGTAFIWAPQNTIIPKLIRSVPQYSLLWKLTNRKVMDFNRAAEDALVHSRTITWQSYWDASAFYNDSPDGLHLGPQTKKFHVQALFSYICNQV